MSDGRLEKVARAMDFDAWDALDNGKDLIKHQVRRSQTLRDAETAISILDNERIATRSDEDIARLFHETYERLAPSFSYQTRKASAVPWADVPPNNKALMTAVCHHVRTLLTAIASEGRVVADTFETARQRALVLFQAYARGVAEHHGRSEEQFIHDVNAFNDELTAALSDTAPPAQGWQPIETAPKRGDYLVYQPEERVSSRTVLPARIVGIGHAGHVREATHWISYPAPPALPENSERNAR